MKKTVTINLGGVIYNIEEDAYILLKEYLDSIKTCFADYEDSQEIMDDIEARLAERFTENLSSSKKVVTTTTVEKLMSTMGTVEDIAGAEKTDGTKKESSTQDWKKKKLYKDPGNAIICGVASGIAAYFGIDPVLVRLAFVASLFFGGVGVLAYIVLCFIVPEAKTTTEKMEMQGQQINLSNLKEAAEENIQAAKESISRTQPLRKITLALGALLRKTTSLLSTFIRKAIALLSILVGVGIIGASFASFVAIFFIFGNILFNMNSPYVDFPIKDFLSGISFHLATAAAFVVSFIPLCFMMILGLSLVRRKLAVTLAWGMTLLMIWIIGLTTLGVLAVRVAPQYNEKMNALQNAEKITETYDLKDFNAIAITGNQKITVTQGASFSVQSIDRQSEYEHPKITVDDETLKIRTEHKEKLCIFCFDFYQDPEIIVTMPVLLSYSANDTVRSEIRGFAQPKFSLTTDGSTDTSIDITTDDLNVDTDGFCKVELSGSAKNMTANLDGPSTLLATKLEAKNVIISSDGSSTARIWATEKLEIQSDGPSTVRYKGTPRIIKNIDGLSRVKKIE